MNKIAPQSGRSGGRQSAASQALPSAYRRVPVADLRRLPIRDNRRLQILCYELTTAPGMVRRPRTHGHGAARLAGGFVLAVCLVKDADGQWYIETELNSFDELRNCRQPLELSAQLLADVYRGLQRRQIAAEGRKQNREARN